MSEIVLEESLKKVYWICHMKTDVKKETLLK